jgi:hypothetical protein
MLPAMSREFLSLTVLPAAASLAGGLLLLRRAR